MPTRMEHRSEAIRRCRYCAADRPISQMQAVAVDYALAYVRYRCRDRTACLAKQTDMELQEQAEIEERRFG